MNDTLPSVPRTCVATVALLLSATACTDTSLTVDVVHPAASSAQVARTEVEVYESSTLSCAQIEFGDVDGPALEAALVTKADLGGALAGISRTDAKVIVARGYAADGSPVTAGCVEKGLISGADHVTINTSAMVVASIAIQHTDADPYQILINATTPTGDPVDGRVVSWQVDAAAGATALTTTTTDVGTPDAPAWRPTAPSCTKGGDVHLHPVPPTQAGGYRVRPRVSWAIDQPPWYSGFTKLPSDYHRLLLAPATHACAIRRIGGVAAIACLDGGNAVELLVDPASAALSPGRTWNPSNLRKWIAAVAVPEGADQAVYLFGERGAWTKLDTVASPPTADTLLVAADAVQLVPACGDQPLALAVHTTDGNVSLMPIGGGAATVALNPGPGQTTELGNAGCVTELAASGTPTLRQVLIVHVTRNLTQVTTTHALFRCAAGQCDIALPISAAVGFTGGAEAQMVGPSFDATGALLTSWVLRPVNNGDRLIERSRIPAAGLPGVLAAGNVDGDQRADLIWAFNSARGTTIQLAYGRTVDGEPLSAIAPIAATQIDDLGVGDLNGDGKDDLLLLTRISSTTGPFSAVTVVLSDVTAPAVAVSPDDPCP
jgi:hypothetical protein